jgi:hypothetical protein
MEMTLTTGVSVQSFVSFRAGYAERIVLIGDKGTIELDRHRASLSLQTARRWGYGARRRLLPPSASDLPWRIRRIISPAHDPSHHRALSAFAGGSDQRRKNRHVTVVLSKSSSRESSASQRLDDEPRRRGALHRVAA